MNTRIEIAELHRTLGASMIYVTHDQTEAMTLADKIVVLRDGRVEQIGSPMELYNNPANQFVAGFLGSPSMNFFPADRIGGAEGTTAGVRPEHLTIADQGPLSGTVHPCRTAWRRYQYSRGYRRPADHHRARLRPVRDQAGRGRDHRL